MWVCRTQAMASSPPPPAPSPSPSPSPSPKHQPQVDHYPSRPYDALAALFQHMCSYLEHGSAAEMELQRQVGFDVLNVRLSGQRTAAELARTPLAPGAHLTDDMRTRGRILITVHSSPEQHASVAAWLQQHSHLLLPPDMRTPAWIPLILVLHCESRQYRMLASSKSVSRSAAARRMSGQQRRGGPKHCSCVDVCVRQSSWCCADKEGATEWPTSAVH